MLVVVLVSYLEVYLGLVIYGCGYCGVLYVVLVVLEEYWWVSYGEGGVEEVVVVVWEGELVFGEFLFGFGCGKKIFGCFECEKLFCLL